MGCALRIPFGPKGATDAFFPLLRARGRERGPELETHMRMSHEGGSQRDRQSRQHCDEVTRGTAHSQGPAGSGPQGEGWVQSQLLPSTGPEAGEKEADVDLCSSPVTAPPTASRQSRAHTGPVCPATAGPSVVSTYGSGHSLFVPLMKTVKQNEHVCWHFPALPATQCPAAGPGRRE